MNPVAHALTVLLETRLVVLFRGPSIDDAVIDAFAEAGLRAVEVSCVAADVTGIIERWRHRQPSMLVGAGTVRRVEQAHQCLAAGAQFLVSPGASPAVGEYAATEHTLHIPGVFTPSEVDAALVRGAEMVKLFPAARLGPPYVRDLLAPFPGTRFLVSGGVDASNVAEFLQAGASVGCVGGRLATGAMPLDELRLVIGELVAACRGSETPS